MALWPTIADPEQVDRLSDVGQAPPRPWARPLRQRPYRPQDVALPRATCAPPSSFTALAIFATEPSGGRSAQRFEAAWLLAVVKGAPSRHDQDDAQAELEHGAGHVIPTQSPPMTAPSTDPKPIGATVSDIAARA